MKLEHGFVCTGTEVKILNFESILKILEFAFSISYFFQGQMYEIKSMTQIFV